MPKDKQRDESTPTSDASGTVVELVPDPAAAAPTKTDELVDTWFARHFHGLGAMLDERLYNHVYAAKDDLKAELRKL